MSIIHRWWRFKMAAAVFVAAAAKREKVENELKIYILQCFCFPEILENLITFPKWFFLPWLPLFGFREMRGKYHWKRIFMTSIFFSTFVPNAQRDPALDRADNHHQKKLFFSMYINKRYPFITCLYLFTAAKSNINLFNFPTFPPLPPLTPLALTNQICLKVEDNSFRPFYLIFISPHLHCLII